MMSDNFYDDGVVNDIHLLFFKKPFLSFYLFVTKILKLKVFKIVLRCLLIDLLHSLETIHAKNVVHVDIKMENILRCSNGKFKLSDFGLAFKPGEVSLSLFLF